MTSRRVAVAVLAVALAAPLAAHDTGRSEDEERRGAASEEVRRAQEHLDDMGYPVGAADGLVGPRTRTAIRNFQRDSGLNATGELNDETLSALESGSSSPPRAETDDVDEPARGGRVGPSAVRRAQETLDRLGYPVEVDGRLGTQTRTAIRNFQRDQGLNATGELDAETRAALEDEGSAASGAAGTRGDR